jgi:radical SAM-linked protein
MGGREQADAWASAIAASGLPVHVSAGRAGPRLAWGAPLPLGVTGEREPAELFLAELVPLWRVRQALERCMPEGWHLADLFDVWVGGPPLAGRVSAADYRVVLEGQSDPDALDVAISKMLTAREVRRDRQKGDAMVTYDLRPLVVSASVERRPTEGHVLRIRTRIHPELGSGRPEEVIAELGERIGRLLAVRSIVRERLILSGETT